MWKYSKQIETPNIEDDIRDLLSEEVFTLYNKCNSEEIKHTVNRVVELLDLIRHLEQFRELLIRNSKKSYRFEDGKHYIDDHTFIDDIDFSGCQFDIEALVIYLFVSCIEGCTQSKFITIKEFLNKELSDNEQYSKRDIINLCDTHSDTYGLNKKFQKVFREWITPSLKNKFADNIVILSMNRKKDFSSEEINTAIQQWKNISIEKKLKKISGYLYNIRSKYTHANCRTFYPAVKWDKKSGVSKNIGCLVTGEIDFPKILVEVIKELCIKILKQDNL